jgi:mRNA interferase RelE/StbE
VAFIVLWFPSAAKALKKLPDSESARIKQALRDAVADPYKAGKTVHPSHYWSTRTGDYRAIYTINPTQNQITVLFVGHRKKIYDDFTKIL